MTTIQPALRYPEISAQGFAHPADRAASAAIHSVPLHDTVVKKLTEWTYERRLRQLLLGQAVRLGEDGEVLARGGNIFRGYLNDPDKTAEALDADGWLHSGDIGQFDEDGYLRIVDRKKELIITAGGKNISPANLEAALKASPIIGQACVIGDGRPFVSALVVLDSEVAPAWATAQGISTTSLADLANESLVVAEVAREVAAANERFSNVEQIKQFTVLADEWLPDSEELTPTMKLKRRGIHAKYAAQIDGMYRRRAVDAAG